MNPPTSDDRTREWTGNAKAVTLGLLIIAVAAVAEVAVTLAGPLLAYVVIGLVGL